MNRPVTSPEINIIFKAYSVLGCSESLSFNDVLEYAKMYRISDITRFVEGFYVLYRAYREDAFKKLEQQRKNISKPKSRKRK